MPRLKAKEAAEYAQAVTDVLDEALSRAEVRLHRLFDPARTGFARMALAPIASRIALPKHMTERRTA